MYFRKIKHRLTDVYNDPIESDGVCKPLTQREIAKSMGISRSYISRIEKRALEKLRARFDGE